MITLPTAPESPDDQATAPVPLRFEDVTQDGRVTLPAFSSGMTEAVWRGALRSEPAIAALFSAGIVPVLTRMVVESGSGPFAVEPPLSAHGCYQLAHALSPTGEVERLHLNTWVDLTAPCARTYGPPPERAGEILRAGQLFSEHVFTRLFGPPDARRGRAA